MGGPVSGTLHGDLTRAGVAKLIGGDGGEERGLGGVEGDVTGEEGSIRADAIDLRYDAVDVMASP